MEGFPMITLGVSFGGDPDTTAYRCDTHIWYSLIDHGNHQRTRSWRA